MDEQALLRINDCFGVWIYRDQEASFLTGWAAQVEVHYTATEFKAVQLAFGFVFPNGPEFLFGLTANSVNMVDAVAGMTFEFSDRIEARIGAGLAP